MSVFVFRRVQEGHHGEPAITRERKHLSKIHESHCKPSTCLACSYLNWREEVNAALCSAVDRQNERTNDKTTTVTLRPRVNHCDARGGTTCFRYVTRKRIITNIPIAHVIHRLYAGFLTDRHWTVVRNLKLRRGLLIVQLKASSILVQNDRNKA